jgi:ankyrin repeat protein
VVIIRNKSPAAPNVALNSHSQFGRGELRTAAAFAILIQAGIIALYAVFTYRFGLKNAGNPIFPESFEPFSLTVAGTLALVSGMLLCTHVVESSTKEERYRASQGHRIRLVWLQQPKTVNEQVFDSFAIFTEDDRASITTSRRAVDGDETIVGADDTASSYPGEKRDAKTHRGHVAFLSTASGVKTVMGTVLGLVGFITQFFGLRSMNPGASFVHLTALLTMVCLRTWVRRNIAHPPQCKPLSPGFELEWFATTLGDLDTAPWLRTSAPESETTHDWRIVTRGWLRTSAPDSEITHDWRIVTRGVSETDELALSEAADEENLGRSGRRISEAHRVMMIRRDLGELADWRGPASTEAVALAKAIEVAMDGLLSSSSSTVAKFTWTLNARYARRDTQPGLSTSTLPGPSTQPVRFRLERHGNTWRAFADEIEAALSLWLYSVNEGEQRQGQQKQGEQGPREDDAWLRAQGLAAKRGLRLLGPSTSALLRDLEWWLPRDTPRLREVKKVEKDDAGTLKDDGILNVENHRVVGCGPSHCRASAEPGETTYKGKEVETVSLWQFGRHNQEAEATHALATESYEPLRLLYAQDMFSAFMWAATMSMTDSINGGAKVQPDNPGNDDSWRCVKLQNDLLSKMAGDIRDTGLGGLDQIYLSIIPPLSLHRKLPQADAMVDYVRDHAKLDEELQHWEEATYAYVWFFRVTRKLPDQITSRATAMLMEYLRTLTITIDLRNAQGDETDIWQLENSRQWIEDELRTLDSLILSSLMRLYKTQGRAWECRLAETRSDAEDDFEFSTTFNFTQLHRLAAISSQEGDSVEFSEIMSGRENTNAKDVHDWTPIHYAAARGSVSFVRDLSRYNVRWSEDVDARDLAGWTPLHYACQRGEVFIVREFLEHGAGVDLRGRNGVTPVHCAAMNGHLDVVRSLRERGAAIHVPDASGLTPLHWAAFRGHVNIVGHLLYDVNKELRDRRGRAALHLAAMGGASEVVRLLVETGADKDRRDNLARTPLHWATERGHIDVARRLVEKGADKNIRDLWGNTPLDLARKEGRQDAIKLLEQALN